MPKWVIGLAFVLAGLILTRVAVHYTYPTPGMDSVQIWHAMHPALKATVLAAWVLFLYGCRTLIKAALNRRRRSA